jgi:WD40 repeat protein
VGERGVAIRGLCVVTLFWLTVASLGAAAQELAALKQEEVFTLQQRLRDAGCYTAAINGIVGPALAAAVKACPSQDPILRIETGMHTAKIWRIAVDAQCSLAATGSDDKTVRLWSLPAGQLLRTQRLPIGDGHLGKVFAVAVSPDGKRVAAGGWNAFYGVGNPNSRHAIYLFDSATGTQVQHIGSFDNVLLHLAFSPDGKRLAVSLGTEGVRVLDVETGAELMADRDYRERSNGIAFGPDGALYAVAHEGFVLRYGPDLKRTAKVQTLGGKEPFSVAVHPQGDRIAIGYDDRPAVDILDAKTLQRLVTADVSGVNNGNLASVAWSSDGKHLVAGGRFQKLFDGVWRTLVRVWDGDGRQLGADIPLADNTIQSLMPCGDAIAFGTDDPSFGLLRADSTVAVLGKSRVPDMRGKLRDSFAVSTDGLRLRFGLEPGLRRPVVFDLAAGTLGDAPQALPDLIAADISGLKVEDWQDEYHPTLDGKPITLVRYERSRSLAVRPDRTGFVLGTEYSLRSIATDGKQRWGQEVPGIAWGVNLARDGELVVAAYGDGTIRWHRWSDGKELLALFVHSDGKRWVAWTPKGYYMASAEADDLIGWHVNRGWEQPADFFPVARFRNQFSRPDIVRMVLQTLDEGEAIRQANAAARRVEQDKTLASQLPPVIRAIDFADGQTYPFSSDALEIAYELRAPSGRAVERIEVLVDGRPLKAVALAITQGPAPSRRTDKLLATGLPHQDIEVALIAWSGEQASEPARLKLHWAGARLEDLLKPKLYALVIGVSDYVAANLKLDYAAKDAVDFSAALQAQEGGMYSKVEVTRLLDREVTREAIVDGLEWLEHQVTNRDIGIIFVAGHGIKDDQQTYWFLPADATQARLRAKAVPQDDLRRTLRNLAGKAILFLDTCHAGQVMKEARRGSADIDALINDFTVAENGVVVFASSTGNQDSIELSESKNGAFTKALVEGIGDGRASFGTGRITPSLLDAFVSDRVKQLTGGKQHPTMAKPETIPDFPFAIVRR